MTNTPTPKTHYVDNRLFYDALVERREQVRLATEAGEELPRISEYIGQCIKHIAEKFSNHRWFNGYSYKEELVADAILVCVEKIDLFDPEISKNPFAYYTQTCYRAFQKRLKTERKQDRVKKAIVKNIDIDDLFDYDHEVPGLENAVSEILQNYSFNDDDRTVPEEVKERKPRVSEKLGHLQFEESEDE